MRHETVAPIAPAREDIVLLDPVCAMIVDAARARHVAEHAGTIYAFCSLACRTRFTKDPGAFLAPEPSAAIPEAS
jgi:Cu+-exporting ATPase